MNYKILNKHADDNKDRMNTVTREEWVAAIEGFEKNVQYQAANLAAHNWDVILIGDRLLFCSAWTKGYYTSKDGNTTELTDKEFNLLYPQVERYSLNWTRARDGKVRTTKISEEGLAIIAGE